MEFYDVIETRRSVRGYLDKPVPADSLAKISRAVQLAPTACNRQPFRLFLFRDPAMRAAICAKVPFPWLSEAPVIAVLAGDASSAWERPDQSSLSAGFLRYRAWAQSWSSAALAARSVLPSNRPAFN